MNPVLVLAFGAGAASAFSPCGIAMLPATIGLMLGRRLNAVGVSGRLAQGVGAGLSLGLGFSVVVAVIAVAFAIVAHAILHILPLVMVALAGALVIMGVLMYFDRLAIGLSTEGFSERVRGLGVGLFGTLTAVGAAYGLAALSCTLPLFIALLAEVASAGWASTVEIVLAFALGVSLVLTAVAVGTAVWRMAMERAIRAALPYIGRVSGVIVVAAGLWISYYWLLGPGHWLL